MTPLACDIATMRPVEPDWLANSIAVTDAPTWQYPPDEPVRSSMAITAPEVRADGVAWIAIGFSRLRKVARLPDDWDGRGSPGTDPSIAEAAASLLRRLEDTAPVSVPPPFVCPIPGGTLQFEWTSGHRHVEVEFVDEHRVAVLQEEAGPQAKRMESSEVPLSRLDEIRTLLRWLVSA